MKQMIRPALIAVAVVLFSASMAFATTQKVRATVPFPFVVENTTMPAGTYTIFPITDTNIEVTDAATSALVSVIQTTPGDNTSLKGNMIFDKIGSRYFLRGVECDYAGVNVEIPETEQEKSARAGQAKSHQVERISVTAK